MAELSSWPRFLCSSIGALVTLTGCDVFDTNLERRLADGGGDTRKHECEQHSDCSDAGAAAACTTDFRCVPLTSDQCQLAAGTLGTDSIVIGGMFSLTGAQAPTNLPRAQSVVLAVNEINAVGGVPGPGSSKRPLTLVMCDEVADLDAAAKHLITDLKVPAIVGPNVSQDVITVTNKYSAAGGTVLITPTGVASSIRDLDDMDLTWQIVPTDVMRAPLMKDQVDLLERQLRAERPGRDLRLSIIFRNDALGNGTRVSLNDLTFNGRTLPDNLSSNVNKATTEPYGPTDSEGQDALVKRQLAFQPDVIVMAGLAEAITKVMNPLEEGWTSSERPYYVLIDSLKVPDLLFTAGNSDSLRRRVRGTGIVPTDASRPVFDAFAIDYQTTYRGQTTTISGMGPAYDATYAIAFALAATREMGVSGAAVAQGLRKLSGPGNGSVTPIQSTSVLSAFLQLVNEGTVQSQGTFAPLRFDERGALSSGRVEVWCIAAGDVSPQYASSQRVYDIETGTFSGSYQPCQ